MKQTIYGKTQSGSYSLAAATQDCEDVERVSVATELKMLQEQIGSLRSRMGDLEERLSPVLAPLAPTQLGKSEGPRAEQSAVVGWVRELQVQIADMDTQVCTLLERLQL